MLPISLSAETASSVPASTPSIPASVAASSTGKTSRTTASMSPASGMATPVTSCSGGPTASTAWPSGRTNALGTEMSTERPSICDSAVPAVPEPMLASSRRASSCMVVNVLMGLRGPFEVLGSGGDTGRAIGGGRVDGVAVDDQGDAAVRQDGAAGDRGTTGDVRRQRAGDQLALADEVRDRQREAAVLAADDHGVPGVRGGRGAQRLRAVEDGQDAVAQDEHAPPGDRAQGLVGEPQRPLDAVERDRVRLTAGLDEQRVHDRERQRQADLRGRAVAELRGEGDLAAELADHRPHGVHADAAAGDVARDLGGREAGQEQQLGRPLAVERIGRLGGDEPALDRALADLDGVDAAPVVANVDDDVAARMARRDLERAGLGLARGDAVLRRLEAVVQRVADEVDERVAQRLDDGAVELGVLADELELDVLGELARQVADEAREAHEDGVDRDHADLHDHGVEGL